MVYSFGTSYGWNKYILTNLFGTFDCGILPGTPQGMYVQHNIDHSNQIMHVAFLYQNM